MNFQSPPWLLSAVEVSMISNWERLQVHLEMTLKQVKLESHSFQPAQWLSSTVEKYWLARWCGIKRRGRMDFSLCLCLDIWFGGMQFQIGVGNCQKWHLEVYEWHGEEFSIPEKKYGGICCGWKVVNRTCAIWKLTFQL